MTTRARVLLVDDHPLVRHGLRGLIDDAPDLAVCGEAEDVDGAIEAVRTLAPQVVLVDLGLKGRSGVELIKRLSVDRPDLPALAVSMFDEAVYAEIVLRAGARGFLPKHAGTEVLLGAIRKVLAGGFYFSDPVARRMLESMGPARARQQETPISRLTHRELEVLERIGKGLATREIADDLGVSAKTIDAHRAHIKGKLDLTSPSELQQFAIRWVHEPKGE
jgi:DNA-binding NarL/FixJ family response regulator